MSRNGLFLPKRTQIPNIGVQRKSIQFSTLFQIKTRFKLTQTCTRSTNDTPLPIHTLGLDTPNPSWVMRHHVLEPKNYMSPKYIVICRKHNFTIYIMSEDVHYKMNQDESHSVGVKSRIDEDLT